MGLHLEGVGNVLRLWDPAAGAWLPTHLEARRRAEDRVRQAEERAREARRLTEVERAAEAEARRQAEEANRQLLAELERLRRELADRSKPDAAPEQP